MLKYTLRFYILTSGIFGILFLFYFLSSCAVKGMPGGGPVDKTPPTIISTFPSPDSTGVKKLSVIHFEFSEAMNEGSIANSIFISPPLKFEAEWQSDSELDLMITDSIKEGQTYVVVLGSSIRDLRNNKLAESYLLAFASGDVIDQGRIEGRVYDLKRNETLTIFAYRVISEAMLDTMQFDKRVPDYLSQTGENGTFVLNYLREGIYRVFAVADQNNSLTIDSDFEAIAIPHRDVLLDSAAIRFSGLNFRTTKIDTSAPVLTNVRPINDRRIHLRLSEKIILPALSQIAVRDSITQNGVDVLAVSQNIEADNILEVYTQPMDSGRVYLCEVNALTDSSGNIGIDTLHSFIAAKTAKADTFRVLTLLPADSAWNVYPMPSVYLEVNQPLNKTSVQENFKINWKSGKPLEGYFKFPSAYEADFRPAANLPLDSVFSVNIDLRMINNLWADSLGDSVITRNFKISNGDDYGEIAGNIVSPDSTLLLYSISATKLNSKESYRQRVQGHTSYLLNYIPDGLYKMSVFQDKDSNAVYSAGQLYPFQFSEPFSVSDDTVKVRKRWESSGVNLYLPR